MNGTSLIHQTQTLISNIEVIGSILRIDKPLAQSDAKMRRRNILPCYGVLKRRKETK